MKQQFWFVYDEEKDLYLSLTDEEKDADVIDEYFSMEEVMDYIRDTWDGNDEFTVHFLEDR